MVSSIRCEQAREGVEDYEYLHLLAELNRAARAKTGAGDPAAARALENAAALVPVPNAGGRYSTKILPRPDKVFEVRREVAEAIEKMRGR